MDSANVGGMIPARPPVLAAGTPVRYRPIQPELFSIRFIGQEGRLIHATAPDHRHCFIEFSCGVVLLVLTRDIEPLN